MIPSKFRRHTFCVVVVSSLLMGGKQLSLLLFFLLGLISFGSTSLPVLDLIKETKVSDLVGVEGRYEASGISLRNSTKELFVVFDNLPEVLVVGERISKGMFVGGAGVKDEGFEGVTFDFQGTNEGEMQAFTVVESIGDDKHYHGVLYMYSRNMMVVAKQELDEVIFDSDNKGFEGMAILRYPEGTKSHTSRYMFLLCEGNSCGAGAEGKDSGHGRIKVFAEKAHNVWKYIDTVKLPSAVDFIDYSGLDIDGTNIAVVSQEESKLWLGELAVKDDDDFHIKGDGTILKFPRDEDGDHIYCNIEGIAFAVQHSDFPKLVPFEREIYVVSDKAKSDQPEKCRAKEQSIHLFRLPSTFSYASESSEVDDVEPDELVHFWPNWNWMG